MVCGRRRRRDSPAARSRGGARPEKPEIGHPGVESTGFWVGRTLRNMRDPQGGFPGLREARLGLAMARGGRRGGASPERACAASGVRYRLKQLAQKQNKTRLVLTEGWNWGKDRRRVLTAKSGGGAPGCTRTGRCGDSPGPWIPWIVAWSPCRGATGVRRHRADPVAWNCGGGITYRRRGGLCSDSGSTGGAA